MVQYTLLLLYKKPAAWRLTKQQVFKRLGGRFRIACMQNGGIAAVQMAWLPACMLFLAPCRFCVPSAPLFFIHIALKADGNYAV